MKNLVFDSMGMKIFDPKKMSFVSGASENFTGEVLLAAIVHADDPSNLRCSCVEFKAGAHSAWHTHPRGQLIIVTEGSGLIQEWGNPVQRIQTGDVIWTPPGVQHWHGASLNSSMTHITTQEAVNGKVIDWLEKVTAQEYMAAQVTKS